MGSGSFEIASFWIITQRGGVEGSRALPLHVQQRVEVRLAAPWVRPACAFCRACVQVARERLPNVRNGEIREISGRSRGLTCGDVPRPHPQSHPQSHPRPVRGLARRPLVVSRSTPSAAIQTRAPFPRVSPGASAVPGCSQEVPGRPRNFTLSPATLPAPPGWRPLWPPLRPPLRTLLHSSGPPATGRR